MITAALHHLQELPPRQRARILTRLALLGAAALLAYAFAVATQEGAYGLAVLPGVGLALVSVGEFVLADLVIDARFPKETNEFLDRLQDKLSTTATHDEIVAALAQCVESFRGCNKERISSTLHLAVDVLGPDDGVNQRGLIQISDYTTAGLGGKRWRTLSATKGIVGRCLRSDQLSWVNFASLEEYQERMVKEFGFTPDEIRHHTLDARSYLAYPVRDRKHLVGVMYFMSTEPQALPLAASEENLERTAGHIVGLLRAAAVL